ncbi:MAG: HAMP domain-containing sensor histidine kinase [Longimicrobiales bacterium]|nr:HAMP domain-containing sensor histidine kinase [Longimicrobiales bacterium]
MADRDSVLGGPPLDPGAFEAALSYRELLGRRLVLNSRVRFAVGGSLLVGPWLGVLAGGLEPGPARLLSGAAAVLLVLNVLLFIQARAHTAPHTSAEAYDRLRRLVYVAVAADYLILALAVALLGGVRSPIMAFYLLHVVLGNLLLTRDAAITVSVVAFLLICAQAYAEMVGWAPAPAFRSPAFATPLDGVTAFAIALVYGVLFVLTDGLMISLVERLRAGERELLQQNERLDQLSRLRREFLRVAIHNMRAPVGASQMLLESLVAGLAGPVNERQQEWILRVGRRMEGLQEMLEDLQVLGQLETEDVERRSERLRFGDVVKDVVDGYGEQAHAAGIDLQMVEGKDVPDVRGIRRLLREALVNYVTNAIKYAPRSGPVVLETKAMIADRGPWARVEVRDRGPGIRAEDVPRLFQEFAGGIQRDAGPEHPASSGLGLSIARKIVESHGGRVGVESHPGEGSTFWLELPSVDRAPAGAR